MSGLRIASNLSLPPEAVTQTFAVLAKRGVGKTYTASVLVEEMLKAHHQVVVADPVGVWWGLRSSSDGKRAGLQIVVLGGDHGDVPLEPTAGEVIADLVVGEGMSAVLDLSLFRKGEQVRFMTDFCERLYHRNRTPLHLMLDEADAFAPQRPQKGQERMLGAVEDLVRRGRARGIGVTLVTQRSAVLNKDVLTQVEVLVALRTIAPQDRSAIDEWVKVHGLPEQRDALMDSLPSLPVGTAWFWSPGWLDLFRRVKVRRRDTFDSSATPKVGAKPKAPRKMADVDLDVVREKIAATIEKAKADDPRELRREIARLKKELAERPTEPVEVEKVVEVPVLSPDAASKLRRAAESAEKAGQAITEAVKPLLTALGGAAAAKPAARRAPTPAREWRPKRTPTPDPSANGEVNLRAGERRMLDTLARRHPMRVTRAQLGTLARFTPSGGTFSTYFGTLKRHGLIVDQGGEVSITEAGFEELGLTEPPPPQSTEEVIDMWRSALRAGERKMLDVLVDAYPASLTRVELGQDAGYEVSGGTFSTYLGTLRRNGLIETGGDEVRASETLFLA